ncbi:hypothetical protein B6S08_15400 [Oceanimonas doudoroffii]|uniref:Uncharacterized protein n=1 Tax=Oceanimonas doudoroffii TaxID=84158 RepID=A0A233RBQ2_9GAMM|nr:hypothetical protein B6S08_15400 [Oceanimonas doudoroffii]
MVPIFCEFSVAKVKRVWLIRAIIIQNNHLTFTFIRRNTFIKRFFSFIAYYIFTLYFGVVFHML